AHLLADAVGDVPRLPLRRMAGRRRFGPAAGRRPGHAPLRPRPAGGRSGAGPPGHVPTPGMFAAVVSARAGDLPLRLLGAVDRVPAAGRGRVPVRLPAAGPESAGAVAAGHGADPRRNGDLGQRARVVPGRLPAAGVVRVGTGAAGVVAGP